MLASVEASRERLGDLSPGCRRLRRGQHRAGAAARVRHLLVDHRPGQAHRGPAVRDRGRGLLAAGRRSEPGRAGCPRRRPEPDERRAGPALRPARDRQPAQVAVPGEHVARAAHPAQRRHRLLRDPARAALRRAERAPAALRAAHPRGRPAPARPDQRHPRPLQDRGRAHGAAPGSLRRRRRAATACRRCSGRSSKRRRQSLELAVEPGVADGLPATRGRFRQVIANLLSNANKFTPDGGAIRIRATWTIADGSRSRVSDTGVGIAPGDQERIFEQFRRVDTRLRARPRKGPAWACLWHASSPGYGRRHPGGVRAGRGLGLHAHAAAALRRRG